MRQTLCDFSENHHFYLTFIQLIKVKSLDKYISSLLEFNPGSSYLYAKIANLIGKKDNRYKVFARKALLISPDCPYALCTFGAQI